MTQGHILIVEDDPDIRDLLSTFLSREGFTVHLAATGAEMRRHLTEAPIDLVTLDLGLNGEDGLVLARDVRAIRDVRIIMISAKSDDVDRIVGLEVGADDYISKPFNLREVLARIRAVLRRGELPPSVAPDTRTIVFGDWCLDTESRELRKAGGESAALTPAEFNLLLALAQRPSRVLSRDTLLDLTRGNDASQFDRSIDTLIGRLRKKIEPDPESPVYIKTIRNTGYMFTRPAPAK